MNSVYDVNNNWTSAGGVDKIGIDGDEAWIYCEKERIIIDLDDGTIEKLSELVDKVK